MTEWSRVKTMKLIELLQSNASLWNSSQCKSRRDNQKRRNELRNIADILELNVSDITRKIRHLRTQYNRDWIRLIRSNNENPGYPYTSNWYAFEYLHFLKNSSKPYRVFDTENTSEAHEHNSLSDYLSDSKQRITTRHKTPRTEQATYVISEDPPCTKDDLSVFGEYIANELRSIKGENDLLVAKKRVLDVIFEIKIANSEARPANQKIVYAQKSNDKLYTTPRIITAQTDSLATPNTTINDIIIDSTCHYSDFKVDS